MNAASRKFSNPLKNTIHLSLLLLLVLLTCFVFIFRSILMHLNPELDSIVILTNSVVQENGEETDKIFTVIFDEAKKCHDINCQKLVSSQLHNTLFYMKEVPSYEGTYFVRITAKGNLEKLFLHGEWKKEIINTPGETKVYNFLRNQNSKDYLRGIRINELYSNMTYLRDFYSEAEIIMPYRINNQIVGAIVKVYGD